MTLKQTFITMLVFLVILGGCSATQQVGLTLGSSAEMRVSLTLEPFFEQYLWDLGSQAREQESLFDLPRISRALEDLGLEILSIGTTGTRSLDLHLVVPNPQEIARTKLDSPDFLTWTTGTQPAKLTITLNQAIIRKLIGTTSLVQQEGLSYLMPAPGSSAQDYLDDLVWMLEDYESPPILAAILRESGVRLQIQTPRDIIQLSGPGTTRIGPRVGEIRIGMIDILTLNGSRTYVVEY